MKKIIFEKEKCIGCGTCVSVCPNFWEMNGDGKVNLIESTEENGVFKRVIEDAGCNHETSQSCPVQCIHVEEDNS